jgi:subtilisin-like proprotein convertase family protein
MRRGWLILFLLCLLCGAGAWFLWPREQGRDGSPSRPHQAVAPTAVTTRSVSTAPQILTGKTSPQLATTGVAPASTNQFAYRLSNTTRPLEQLLRDDHAILLENALIDTRNPLNLAIPKNLQSSGDPGAYIVQARGPIDNVFRTLLAQAGATMVAYLPNNAYLVRASANVAGTLQINPLIQAVIPYEPYYKVQSSLLAYDQSSLPEGAALNLGLFNDNAEATIQQIEKLGGQVFAEDQSPFGPIVRVVPPRNNWTALAQLAGVQIVEPYHPRTIANDLARVTLGVSVNTLTNGNYLELTGAGVIVEVNDTGIDQNHPDLRSRVFGDAPQSLVDTNGHGTHVAGIIAGDGTESTTVTNALGSINPGTNSQYRGKAPAATLYSVGGIEGGADTNVISDQYFQEVPALTNALISNNSWGYAGDSVYDLAAASYDAATRDALPEVPGSQPVLFVFAAGNNGGINDDNGTGGNPDSILSPATAKDVVTVGALEQLRNITNVVTNLDGSVSTPWQLQTDTGYQVAGYSSRGNVGIGYEGAFGRYKPDVVAPGTFVISTRSEQWDTNAYYNPTNVTEQDYTAQTVTTNAARYYLVDLSTTPNAEGVTIQVVPNLSSPVPLNLPIYVATTPDPNIYPDPATPGTYFLATNFVTIPSGYLASATASGGFNFAVGDSSSQPVSYDLIVDLYTTNDLGDYFDVLSGLNDSIGTLDTDGKYPYRYETGTSMAAAAISGVLALMQQFYTNAYGILPSPALLKAMLINGSRATTGYNFQVTNSLNLEGWGLADLTNSLPPGITIQINAFCSTYVQDQSPANALATGDSQTYYVSVTNAQAQVQPLRITLAWTDPPGDPVAAIKLVNDLVLVVTNMDTGTIYYGNDIAAGNTFNTPEGTNTPPAFDSINNIQNVYISPLQGTNFSVTVMGYRVNVNAVTAQSNNVVQDYALVISSGNGAISNAMTVTAAPPTPPNYTGDQQITYVSSLTNNTPLLNQLVGANTPLLGTNTILFSTNAPEGFGPTNWQVTIGMINQWHFYVVSNTTSFTNAAFVTFVPDTLSIPRMGVFADSQANATRPEADIDLYVSTSPGLTNLDPPVISNCVVGTQVGASGVNGFAGASLSRGGSEFVVDTNSQPNEVYYIGVKSEDQMASEYDFLPIFSSQPFSLTQGNGTQFVNGLNVPVFIPGGNPAVPGYVDVVGLEIYPMTASVVTVTNSIYAQDFGALVGAVYHNGVSVILNSHSSINVPGAYGFTYDDSGEGTPGAINSVGPGSLLNFIGGSGIGEWILHEADNAEGLTNIVENFGVTIQPHQDLTQFVTNTVQPNTWFYDYIDVPPGATNLTIYATNVSPVLATPPLELFVKYGSLPTSTNFDEMVLLNLGNPPGNSISIGPPLASGRYFIGVYNPSTTESQEFTIIAKINTPGVPAEVIYNSSGPVPILDDAVTTNSIVVPDNATIYSMEVALRVDHPRISDLVFHLISPDGTRDLLVENRGGDTANMGSTIITSNIVAQTFSGGYQTSTNVINSGTANGTLQISYNFYTIPDEMAIFYTNGVTNFDSGMISGAGVFNISYTNSPLTIVMNPYGNQGGLGDAWTYTVNAVQTNYYTYLVLTEDTNKTTTPIKFAVPPFTSGVSTNGIPIIAGPIQNPANGHYYYLLQTNTWTASEAWAEQLGGHLATIQSLAEDLWVSNTFANYGNTNRFLWIGLWDPSQDSGGGHANNFVWVSGDSSLYRQWANGEPNNCSGNEYYVFIYSSTFQPGTAGEWNDDDNVATVCNEGTNYAVNGVVEVDTLPNEDLYYLPEQSLDIYDGENAAGTWTLEIQDDRVGATNPAPTLVSWQLRFLYTTTGTSPNGIPPGTTQTNIIQPGSWAYYPVNVPTNADTATNILLFATGPLNMWFNQTNDPVGNTGVGDVELLLGVTNGSSTLSTFSVPTNIVPGGVYYIGLYNPNAVPVTNGFEVDFHYFQVSPLTNGVPITNIISGTIAGDGMVYRSVAVPPGADYATNLLLSSTVPVNVWFNQNKAPVGLSPPDYLLISNATNGTNVLSYSTVPPLVPGATYYLAVQNTNGPTATSVLEVNFHLFSPLTNGVPVTNTVPTNGFVYYQVQVPTNADYATNLLLFANLPVNVWFNQYGPPTGLSPSDSLLISNATSGTSILSASTTPPLAPGATYYLGVQNTNNVPVTFGLEVNFHFISTLTNGVPTTNSVPSNSFAYYEVQVPTNVDYATNLLLFANLPVNVWFNQNGLPTGLSPSDSLLISNATSGTSILSASTTPPLIPGATYYLGVQNTNAVPVTFGLEVNFHFIPVVSNIIIITGPTITATNISGTNGFLLQWSGPTNYQYTIQWKTNLAPIIPWNTVMNPVINVTYTPTNGNYSWFDDGSLTGGWPPEKFYRVLANLLSGPITTNSTTVTNVIVPGTITPLTVVVPASATAATNLLVSATGPVNVWFNQTGQPTGNTNAGDVLMLSAATGGSFLLTGSSVPPLVPGANYYLGLQNPGASNVTFVFQVNFAYASSSNAPASISSITVTNINGTNAILLKWVAPTNYQFQVQWATNLPPTVPWNTISNVVLTWSGVVSPTNAAFGIFQFLDDGSLTGGFGPVKFYRLIEYPYSTPIPQTLTIINSAVIGGAVQFQWVAPTNYQYQVLWTTNLGLPLASWFILTNPALGLSNGVYTFTDTNQTGPTASPKFFRLLEY